MSDKFNCIIMGAAGRDFHNFQTFFRDRSQFHVCAFTATQIPFIETRSFPKSLAGPAYADDIPIFPEERLSELIRTLNVDFVFLAYSDLSHTAVMHKASQVQACGASFVLLGPNQTQLTSARPIISVTAVRTGAGKSPLSQWLARSLTDGGYRTAVLRHPMPYGNLERQAVERFSTRADLDQFECTIEEREEYEPYVDQGLVVFAGVNYEAILRMAESEADVVVWDGGNNDFSFLRPTVSIVVVDALRSGHEVSYYPGETNLLSADILVINKVSHAAPESVKEIRDRIQRLNAAAEVIESDLLITADRPESITGRRVLIVEDGPTLTHGEMSFGAGTLAARQYEAAEMIDPRPFAAGSIAKAYSDFPHIGRVVPALGYSAAQQEELRQTINASGADVVVDASPCRLDRLLELTIPLVRVQYGFRQISGPALLPLLLSRLGLAAH